MHPRPSVFQSAVIPPFVVATTNKRLRVRRRSTLIRWDHIGRNRRCRAVLAAFVNRRRRHWREAVRRRPRWPWAIARLRGMGEERASRANKYLIFHKKARDTARLRGLWTHCVGRDTIKFSRKVNSDRGLRAHHETAEFARFCTEVTHLISRRACSASFSSAW